MSVRGSLVYIFVVHKLCFNTTSVSVRDFTTSNDIVDWMFQYNFCVGSSILKSSYHFLKRVSIQLLCRFEVPFTFVHYTSSKVSIQLLCRFELLEVSEMLYLMLFQYNFCVGSRQIAMLERELDVAFQYNFCVGSSLHLFHLLL